MQAHKQVALAEGEKAKRTAQQLLALAHQTSKVTEAYEVTSRTSSLMCSGTAVMMKHTICNCHSPFCDTLTCISKPLLHCRYAAFENQVSCCQLTQSGMSCCCKH